MRLFFLAAAIACGLARAQTWNVFGPDDRLPLTTRAFPLRTIGLVFSRGTCTGTLVGQRLVLTAAHCLPDRGRLSDSVTTYFYANVVDGVSAARNRPYAIQAWTGGWRQDSDSRAYDWAILLLNEAPVDEEGRGFGWLGVRGDNLSAGSPVTTIGFSEDFRGGRTAGVHAGCRIRETFRDGGFYHDCDGWAGISGGPVLDGDLRVAGITNAHFSDGAPGLYLPAYSRERANIGAGARNFIGTLLELKRHYP